MWILVAVAVIFTIAVVAYGYFEIKSPQARRAIEARREQGRKVDMYDPYNMDL